MQPLKSSQTLRVRWKCLTSLQRPVRLLSRSLAKNSGLIPARLVHCHLLRREGNLSEARVAYESLLQSTIPRPEKVDAMYGYGLTLDQLLEPEAAFYAFTEANKLASGTPEFKQRDVRRYLDNVKACREWFTRDFIRARSLPSDDQSACQSFLLDFRAPVPR